MMGDIKETAIPQMDASEDGVNQCHFFLFSVRESHGAALPSTCLYNGNIPMQFLAFSLLIHVLRFLLCSHRRTWTTPVVPAPLHQEFERTNKKLSHSAKFLALRRCPPHRAAVSGLHSESIPL